MSENTSTDFSQSADIVREAFNQLGEKKIPFFFMSIEPAGNEKSGFFFRVEMERKATLCALLVKFLQLYPGMIETFQKAVDIADIPPQIFDLFHEIFQEEKRRYNDGK